MIIYGSAQWVDPTENSEWYQLSVINQWDWKTKAVCFKNLGGQLISYTLHKSTVSDNTQTVSITIPKITQEMKDELVKMGYELISK